MHSGSAFMSKRTVAGHGLVDAGRRRALGALPALALGSLSGLNGLLGALPAFAQPTLDAPAIERAAAEADLHSVLVWKSGRMLVEHYRHSKDRPIGEWFAREVAFAPDVLHDLRSISKSVVALLVGQAVGRGEIDPAAAVLDFYPALADLRRDGRERIRIAHLLDMASGLAWDETTHAYGSKDNDETRLWWDGGPARHVLDRAVVADPGSVWNYNGGHTALLAEILEQRTGRSLLDIVRNDLFEPLGITRWEWRSGSHRRPLAYAGLRMAPPDLLRLGQMLLAKGAWQGRQVVPAEWIAASMRPGIVVGSGPLRYSLHWWHGTVPHGGRQLAWTAGVGNGGQRLFVVPELELAVVFNAGAYGGPSERIGRLEFALFRRIVAAA